VSGLKVDKVDKKQTYTKTDANSILEYFEYFCQISSKSILIILSYTVSTFVRFLRHSVIRRCPTVNVSGFGNQRRF